jgi:glycogen synthase
MSPPSRILMTADAVGGVWTYAVDMAAGLARRGVATTLMVLGPSPSPARAREVSAIPGVELVETGLPLDWTASEPAEVLDAGAVIRGLARRTKADLVHLNSPAIAAGLDVEVPVLGMCHSCLATWWTAVKEEPMPADFLWRTRLQWQGMMACDALAAPTAAFAEELARAYETPMPFVIHNGRRPPLSVATSVREPIVFTTGRLWDEAKNVATLDAAARMAKVRLLAAGPDVGPNPGNQIVLSHAEALGELSGPRVAERLRTAAIYASAALYEPFGLGVLEAAQAGCALVLSDIPTFRELWDGAALFVPPRDADAYADAFRRVLDNGAERRRLAEAALRRSWRYTDGRMVEATLDLYRKLNLFAADRRGAAA